MKSAFHQIKSGTGITRLGVVMCGIVSTLVILSGCSEELPTDYSSAHRDAFLTACSSPLEDPRLLSDVCVCVYDRLEDDIPFSRFVAISEALAVADETLAPAPMPTELADAVADCMVSEADL